MKIAIDAMGGDNAPRDIVRGALAGCRKAGIEPIFVGKKECIEPELEKWGHSAADTLIVHTDEYLVEGEAPAYALRAKRSASIALCMKLVREGKADAVFSAGPTGGVVASALGYLGTVEGISRPVIGGSFLGFAPKTVIMDLGGNIDSRPDQLLDFGIVGTVFARTLLDVPNPTVALLSVGAEEGKGNETVKAAYPLFKKSGLNFIGNVEGHDIVLGKANVVICDGFMGNVLMKFCEGFGKLTARWMEKQLLGKLPEAEIAALVKTLVSKTNAAEEVGGGPLWAVNGIVIKAHGRCTWEDVARSMVETKRYADKDIVGALKKELAAVRNNLKITPEQA